MNTTVEKFKDAGTPAESGAEIDLVERTVTESEAIEALKRQGIVKIPKTRLQDMVSLGIWQTGVGVFKIQRGQTLFSQQRLNVLIDTLVKRATKEGKEAPSTEELTEIARTAGYLTSKITESQHLLVDMEERRSGPWSGHDPEEGHRPSFGAGQEVKPGGTQIIARDVHIHSEPKKELQKPGA